MSYQSVNPFTGEKGFSRPYATKDEITAQIDRVNKAYRARLSTDGYDKVKLKANLETMHKILQERKEEYAKIITDEVGKPLNQSIQEVDKAIKHTKHFIDHFEESTKSREIPAEGAKKSGYHIDPLGLIYVIFPFNFPFSTPFRVIVPTLLAGNGILVKPPSNCGHIGEAMAKLFQDSGMDHVDVIYCSSEQSEHIMSNPAVQGLHLTGSTKAGKILAEICGRHLKRTSMELGGNDAYIVLEDADVGKAVENVIASRLRNAGQVCTSAKRAIVHESIYEEFVKTLKEKVLSMKVGSPYDKDTEIGPVVKASAAKEIHEQIQKTLSTGDELLFGGEAPQGALLKPSAVRIIDASKSYVAKEEVFGPLFSVITFKTEEEAIKIANDCPYGLGGTIVTKDLERGAKLSRLVEAGAVFVNKPVTSFSNLPAGGVKESGWGRDCGQHGVETFANIKTYYIC